MNKSLGIKDCAESEQGFREEIMELSGIDVSLCYQCQKCFFGCPVAKFMDLAPNVINRMVQYDFRARVLESSTIWLCASCVTCAVRCPNGIDIPKLMDTLKQLALKQDRRISENEIRLFHQLFLDNIKIKGRLNEFLLIKDLKVRTRKIFKDILVGIKLFFNGKLDLFSEKIKDTEEIKKIFEQSRGEG